MWGRAAINVEGRRLTGLDEVPFYGTFILYIRNRTTTDVVVPLPFTIQFGALYIYTDVSLPH